MLPETDDTITHAFSDDVTAHSLGEIVESPRAEPEIIRRQLHAQMGDLMLSMDNQMTEFSNQITRAAGEQLNSLQDKHNARMESFAAKQSTLMEDHNQLTKALSKLHCCFGGEAKENHQLRARCRNLYSLTIARYRNANSLAIVKCAM